MESSIRRDIAHNATGVELRFVLKGESAKLVLSAHPEDDCDFCAFHVYYGGLQGGWQDHEVDKFIPRQPREYEFRRPKNQKNLETMTQLSGLDWDPCVVRVIFDRGWICVHDVIGDVEPPRPEQCPAKTLLCYGSSITHGSNSIDMSHSWVSLLGYNLGMDVRNLGMAGSCCIEPAMADWLAEEGEQGKWDVAVLELGINVLGWDEDKIHSRVNNILQQVACRNPEKPVFVVSPFYYGAEALRNCANGTKWRRCIEQIIAQRGDPNVTYINGLDALDHIRYMTADEIHPNIYGHQRIAQVLEEKLRAVLK